METRYTQSLEEARSAWTQAARALARTPGVLLDVGGGRPFQGHIKAADLGPTTRYFSLDLAAQPAPYVQGNALALPFATASVDAILCDAVLEHVPAPWVVVQEMYRVLKPGGRLHIGVPFIYPYHDAIDFYRFSEDGLRYLCRDFTDLSFVAMGDYFYSALAFGLGFRLDLVQALQPVTGLLRAGLLRVLTGRRPPPASGRRVARGFWNSPIGWYLFCVKPRLSAPPQ